MLHVVEVHLVHHGAGAGQRPRGGLDRARTSGAAPSRKKPRSSPTRSPLTSPVSAPL